jgi:GAF domain-containing protein
VSVSLERELHGLRDDNRTLYGVIKLVSSELAVESMLQRVVDLASEATDCHACFIYLLEERRLTIRAASPVFADAVGKVQLGIEEGLTGWVARHRTPEFIRDGAMQDPRMKYVPLLKEEQFQSMVAVPILSREGETIGVIVLHTEAPREFSDDTVTLLEHIASLVSGAIENAQLYDRERRRAESLAGLSALAQEVAALTDASALGAVVAGGVRRLLRAEVCQLYRLDDAGAMNLFGWAPEGASDPASPSTPELLSALDGHRKHPPAKSLWPEKAVQELMVTPLVVGSDRVGLLCVGSHEGQPFHADDTEIARAIAHLGALAMKRTELIERLTKANIANDMFEALAAGATQFAAEKAAKVRCELSSPYAILCAEPAGELERASGSWRASAEAIARGLAKLAPRTAIEAGPGPVRALLSGGTRRSLAMDELLHACSELGQATGASIGISEARSEPAQAAQAYHEAVDAAAIGHALLEEGGAIAYSEVGAYRYLVHIEPEAVPRDRMRTAVDILIDYDRRRRTALLDTLERYLTERRSVVETARALFVHPNTLRQRLGRIEELTGVKVDDDDLLSLELAIKLARLHGRSRASGR